MSLCRCGGDGLYFDEANAIMKVCDCPAGYRRREYFEKTPEELRRAAIAARRKERRKKQREPEQLAF